MLARPRSVKAQVDSIDEARASTRTVSGGSGNPRPEPPARGAGHHDAQHTQGDGGARSTAQIVPRRRLAAASPLHVVLATAAIGTILTSSRALIDFDSLLHVALGREILAEHRVSGLGAQWLAAPVAPWRTSQWLSEVVMAAGVDQWGWRVLVLARFAALATLFVLLAATLLPRRPAMVTTPVLLLTLVAVGGGVQDRPQTVSLLFTVLLGALCVRMLQVRTYRPPYLLVGVASLLWAQFHGLWVLAPAAFAVVVVGALLDRQVGTARRAGVALLVSLAGLVNPWGPGSLLLPVRFRAAAGEAISEWAATRLESPYTVAWAAMVALMVVAWARSDRVPRSELLWGLAWTAYGATAYRNVALSAVLLAPAAVVALDRAWGAGARRSSRPAGRYEGAVLAGVSVAIVVTGFVVAVAGVLHTDPLRNAPAHRIALRLAESPRPLRVFNGYNASGSLVGLAGDKVRLAIDGRSDLWGAAAIRRGGDVQRLDPGWEDAIAAFRPDAFVLPLNSPLTTVLVREGTWRIAQRDGKYVLLLPAPPGTANGG